MDNRLRYFINGEVALQLCNEDDYKELMKWCKVKGLKWKSNDNPDSPLVASYWNLDKEATSIRLVAGGMIIAPIKQFCNHGIRVEQIDAETIAREEIKPVINKVSPLMRKFIEGNMVFRFDSRAMYDKCLAYLDRLGYKWQSGVSLTLGSDRWNNDDDYCIRNNNGIAFGSIKMYQEWGLGVHTFSDNDLIVPQPSIDNVEIGTELQISEHVDEIGHGTDDIAHGYAIEMGRYAGRVMTVSRVYDDCVMFENDNGRFRWDYRLLSFADPNRVTACTTS